eukprot:2470445-Lingulodinium_polyedra.AAC.1
MVKSLQAKPAASDKAIADAPAAASTAMGQRNAQSVMDQLKRLEKGGRPYPLTAYKSMKGHQAKRQFAEKLFLDPAASFLSAEEINFQRSTEGTTTKAGWCYLWDVARLNGVEWNPNSEGIVGFCKMLVAECNTKESPQQSIRDQGWLLYEYSKEMETDITEVSGKKVNLKAEAKIEQDDYQGCLEMVKGNKGSQLKNSKASSSRQHGRAQAEALDMDPKRLFMKFSTSHQGILQKIINKNQGIVERLKNCKSPWCTKGFINK